MKRMFLVLVLICVPICLGTAKTNWKTLDEDLQYTSLKVNPGHIHAFKVNPKKYKFGVVTAKQIGKKSASVKTMAKKSGALIAVNGGFFTPEYDSLGLIISDGKTVNPLKKTSWWSVFYIMNGIPRITHTNSFRRSRSISMAVQSGPRLVVNGSVPRLKPSMAARSAICINGKQEVILISTEDLLIQPKDLAEHLRKRDALDGLGCHTVLNLDGGSSAQMYAKVGSFKLDVSGFSDVANAVVVQPK